ncbi:MAG TPA: ABC transporter ATP-binding protein, partial [Acidimicrobiales bacterium]|nr:ABC transporter ATP-binding protein [Acidimicrobiales bacterium]
FLALGARRAARFSPGDVASRLVGQASAAGAVAPDVVRSLANLVPAVGAIVALTLIDPWLSATFLVALPLLGVVLRSFARDASDTAARYFEVQGGIAGRLVDALGGARTIAAAGTAEREVDRVLEPLPTLHAHGMAVWRAQIRASAQDALLIPLVEVAVLAVAGALLARGRVTTGEVLAAAQYAVLGTNLGATVHSVARLARARAGASRAAEVLELAPLSYGTASLPPGGGRVELRHVSVSAGDRRVLDGVDLVVPAGTLVAVVGPSGAGKSLVAALVGRLVDPDEGEVLLDGVPLPRLHEGELRRAVVYGFERPSLIGGTVADVIAFGPYRPPAHVLQAAAGAAQADAFIRRLPEGYATPLAQAPMSGGEAQRLGLARAFAHAGRVVVLDDVTASLDTVTEHEISRVLTDALADRTRILVAHRASTAARADLVVWLDGGRLRAVGPHAELWSDPAYRGLFRVEEAAGPAAPSGATMGRPSAAPAAGRNGTPVVAAAAPPAPASAAERTA